MSTHLSEKNVKRLLAEADELAQRINSDILNDMEEDHRLQFEIHARNLEKIKSEVQGGIDQDKASKTGAGAEGIHEAILDIVKAMKGLTKYLS